MTLFRLRHYGQELWTELCFEGELEELVAEALLASLSEVEGLHVQRRAEGEWEDWEGEEE